MKRKRRSPAEVIADSLDFPDSVSPLTSDIRIIGTRELSLDGCLGILEYERDEIRLRLKGRVVSVTGEELTLKAYYTGHVSVKGRIFSVGFEEGL